MLNTMLKNVSDKFGTLDTDIRPLKLPQTPLQLLQG